MNRSRWIAILAVLAAAGLLLIIKYNPRRNHSDARAASNDYVDPAQCAACHPDIAERYQHTGMGRSFSRLRPATTIEDFKTKNTLYHRLSDRYYTTYEKDGRYFQRRYQLGPNGEHLNVVEMEINYVLGSGNHARAYLHLNEQKKLIELPAGWYAEKGGYWDMNPGYDRRDHEDFRREITLECIFCHNGYPDVKQGSDLTGADAAFPVKIPEGIDCQRCHGPGGAHVRATQTPNSTLEMIRSTIVNPARLSPDRKLEVCLQCHLEFTSGRFPSLVRRFDRGVFSYRPGQPLGDYVIHFHPAPGVEHPEKFEIVGQGYRLMQSACFLKSGGVMNCNTCHDPHNVPRGEEATRHYISVCRNCHATRIETLTAAGRHPSSGDCISCHMPKRRTDDVVHVVMTDHYIQRNKPQRDLLAPITEEAAGTNKTEYMGEVVAYYPPNLPPTPDNELYLAAAQVVEKTNLKDGIPRLRSAIDKYHPAEGEFYFVLAEAYRNTNTLQLAIPMYEEALKRRPDFWPALQMLGRSFSGTRQPDRAVESLERAAKLAKSAAVFDDLAIVYRGMSRLNEAKAALKNALTLNAGFPAALNDLGRILAQTGDTAGAEQAFIETIRAQPDLTAPYTNLGNTLARTGNLERARYYLERATAQAVPEDPALANARSLLGDVLAQQGLADRAITEYQKALKIDPSLALAHLGLGSALASKGRKAEAIVEFEKLADSSDMVQRRVAQAAIEKLRQ